MPTEGMYAVKYPQDVYTRDEQNKIRALNNRRKELQRIKDIKNDLNMVELRELEALEWVLHLIEEVGFVD